jgi:hypothetical protein
MEVGGSSFVMVDSHNKWLDEMPLHFVRAGETNEDQAVARQALFGLILYSSSVCAGISDKESVS